MGKMKDVFISLQELRDQQDQYLDDTYFYERYKNNKDNKNR